MLSSNAAAEGQSYQDNPIQQALHFIDSDQLEQALQTLARLAAANDGAALRLRAKIYRAMGKLGLALQDCLELAGNERTSETYCIMAAAYNEENNYQEALATCKLISEKNLSTELWCDKRLQHARAYIGLKKYTLLRNELAALSAVLETLPNTPQKDSLEGQFTAIREEFALYTQLYEKSQHDARAGFSAGALATDIGYLLAFQLDENEFNFESLSANLVPKVLGALLLLFLIYQVRQSCKANREIKQAEPKFAGNATVAEIKQQVSGSFMSGCGGSSALGGGSGVAVTLIKHASQLPLICFAALGAVGLVLFCCGTKISPRFANGPLNRRIAPEKASQPRSGLAVLEMTTP